MPDIYHQFPIQVAAAKVFAAIATPTGLDAWWTKRSSGKPTLGMVYELWFGPEYDWRAKVTKCITDVEFELTITEADEDWRNTRVGFALITRGESTQVNFYHQGWPENNEHYRISTYCWAMYLRILKRHLEFGEWVEYDKRLEV